MAKRSRLLRVVIAFALAWPMVAVAGTPAAAAPVTAFFAYHTRDCALSYARGTIDWNPTIGDPAPRVDVVGALVDDLSLCGQRPQGEPFARFTAYVDGARVDEERVALERTGDIIRPVRLFGFSLTAPAWTELIDQVDVQVCRTAGPMLPAFTCGDAQTYRRPRIGPAV